MKRALRALQQRQWTDRSCPAIFSISFPKAGECAIAINENGAHPTFAYWALSDLMAALSEFGTGEGAALRENCETLQGKRSLI